MVSSLHLPYGRDSVVFSVYFHPTSSTCLVLLQFGLYMSCCFVCVSHKYLYIICIFTTLDECLLNCWGRSWDLIRVLLAWGSSDPGPLFGTRLFLKCLSSSPFLPRTHRQQVCFVHSSTSYYVSLDVSEKAQEFRVCIIKRSSSMDSVGRS